MPLPNDDAGRPPFTPAGQDGTPGDSVPAPLPPAMRSPYRPDEQLPEDSPHRSPLRLPMLHHGAGHDAEQAQQPVPPVGQRPGQDSSGWGTGAAGGGQEGFRPPPPQFSHRPEAQPPYAPVPEATGTNRRKGVMWATVGTAVVAVAVGVGVLALGFMGTSRGSIAGPTPSGSTKTQATNTAPSAPKSTPAAWSAPANGDSAAVVGSWLVDGKTIVRGDGGALKAYDTGTGQALWTFQPPGPTATVCAMSPAAAPKIGVVQYGTNGSCTTIAAINTDNGKTLWSTTPVIPKGSAPGTSPTVSLDSEVTVWQVGTTLTAWTVAGGKQLWTTDVAQAKPACRLVQFSSQDGNLALVEDCGSEVVVAMKDAHTGRDLWRTPVPPNGLQGAQFTLVHASPAMVHVTSQGAQAVDRYYSFDSNGKALPPINGSGDFGVLDLNAGSKGQQHPQAHLQDNIFIAPTADKDAKASLVAFDLNSGNKLWQAPAIPSGPATVVSLNQKWVTVFDGDAGGAAARILAFGTSGGGPNATGITKETLSPDFSGPAAAAYVAGNRVIVLPAAPEKGADVVAFPWGDAQ